MYQMDKEDAVPVAMTIHDANEISTFLEQESATLSGDWQPPNRVKSEKIVECCANKHRSCPNLEDIGAGRKVKLLACGGCNTVKYCCRGCQKEDRSSHKALCKKIQGSHK